MCVCVYTYIYVYITQQWLFPLVSYPFLSCNFSNADFKYLWVFVTELFYISLIFLGSLREGIVPSTSF